MQLGKVANLRRAARALDRTLLPSGRLFSFWKQLGPPIRVRGFVSGRMLQQGCLVPAVGGGLCQLSNALYDVALAAGCQIVERHPHSRIVPGSAAAQGRDATVAWNYVDLRFRSDCTLLLRVWLEQQELVVSLQAAVPIAPSHGATLANVRDSAQEARSCGTCGEHSCFRFDHRGGAAMRNQTAFLVYEAWPEFARYVAAERREGDVLRTPINGQRWKLPRYAWNTSGFKNVRFASTSTLLHSLAARRLAEQGPARRQAEARAAENIARQFARTLTPDIAELCVAQAFLPYLWRDGHLGGRRFRVLMTTLPIRELERRLDEAASIFPDRATLTDFRAPRELADWESAALAAADSIVTPHADIARLFEGRTVKLDWAIPAAQNRTFATGRRIAFPGPTVARKGCYELREAASSLNLEVVPLGSELEGPDFWSDVHHVPPGKDDWLEGISLVVQPALVEQAPRRLLAALAAGIPVVATPACGLVPQPGLAIVPPNDSAALTDAVRALLLA
ncbi:MAG TPA: VanW family protein [Rhizomicrobium sp.]